MSDPHPFRQQLKTSRRRMVRYALSRLSGIRQQKSQRLYFVTINGQRFKRIILRDTRQAEHIEENLERFGASARFPTVVARYEHELWMNFVEGEMFGGDSEDELQQLAAFYADVYQRSPRRTPIAETPVVYRLQRDLHFLHGMGVLGTDTYRDLARRSEEPPAEVWIGFDYTDPVRKNFVVREDGSVCAIDVESLEPDALIGTGVARARLRWMSAEQEARFTRSLADLGAPDFQSYLPFVRLAFLSAYTKLMFLERKWKHIEPGSFEALR